MAALQLMGLTEENVEFVLDLSPSNITHPLVQTVADGKVSKNTLSMPFDNSKH